MAEIVISSNTTHFEPSITVCKDLSQVLITASLQSGSTVNIVVYRKRPDNSFSTVQVDTGSPN